MSPDPNGATKQSPAVIGAGTPRRGIENNEEMMHENGHQAQGASGLLGSLLDALHEMRIKRARLRMLRHHEKMREASREFTRLINARSPRQAAQMEAQRGLRG